MTRQFYLGALTVVMLHILDSHSGMPWYGNMAMGFCIWMIMCSIARACAPKDAVKFLIEIGFLKPKE